MTKIVKGPETAIVQIPNDEHDKLHKDARGWVNANKVFPQDVKSVDMLPHDFDPARAKGATTWVVMFAHFPHCAVVGACYPG